MVKCSKGAMRGRKGCKGFCNACLWGLIKAGRRRCSKISNFLAIKRTGDLSTIYLSSHSPCYEMSIWRMGSPSIQHISLSIWETSNPNKLSTLPSLWRVLSSPIAWLSQAHPKLCNFVTTFRSLCSIWLPRFIYPFLHLDHNIIERHYR